MGLLSCYSYSLIFLSHNETKNVQCLDLLSLANPRRWFYITLQGIPHIFVARILQKSQHTESKCLSGQLLQRGSRRQTLLLHYLPMSPLLLPSVDDQPLS